jgi:hypothetical protein
MIGEGAQASQDLTDLLIATPTHGGQVTTHYAESMSRLLVETAGRYRVRHGFIDGAMVAWARNAFVTAVLSRPAVTHLLFIDADMGFSPGAVTRMLDSGKPFVGCICPARSLDNGRLHFVAADRLIGEPEDGFVRTERIGMGLTLLRRDVLERLSSAHPELWSPAGRRYAAMGVGERVFQPFRAMLDVSGLELSEDLSFAKRWTDTGGEIWACVDEEITHVGQMAFTGAFWASREP